MGEHTPVPWRVIVEADRLDEPCIVAPDHSDDFSRFVATCHGGLCDNEQQQHANAAFIVEAVNSYDRSRATIAALVGKLTVARNMLESYAKHDERIGHIEDAAFTSRVVAEIDAALSASKEGV